MLSSLSPDDLSAFMASGGSAEALSQLHLTPRAPLERDALYFLLQLLRQCEFHPHLRKFNFPLGGTAVGAEMVRGGAAAPLPGLQVPDFYAWLCQRAVDAGEPKPPKPVLLTTQEDRGAMSSLLGFGGGTKRPATGVSLDLDLFAAAAPEPVAASPAPPPAPPAPASAPAREAADDTPTATVYSDLDALKGAGDI